MEDSALEPTLQDVLTRPEEQPSRPAAGSPKGEARNKSSRETAPLFPDEPAPVKDRGRQQRPAKKRVFSLLAEAKVASQDARFVQALGAFREAINLSQGVRSLREIAFDTAVEEADQLLPENWRVAEALLSELPLLNLERAAPSNFEARIRGAARDEAIANVLNRVKLGDDLEEIRERLKRAIRLYPGEAVLEMHLKRINLAAADSRSSNADLPNRDLQSRDGEGVALESSPVERPTEPLEEAPVETKPMEDSVQPDVLAQVKALLETGPLREALKACKQASEKYPHSPGLWVLAKAIREKEEEIRLLLEKGEKDLAELNVRAARESFLQASGLAPLDHALRTGISDKLHARARRELENDWRSSEALLALADRISPGRFVPPDLVEALAERKRQDSPETPPDAGSDAIIDVEVLEYAEATRKPRERRPAPSPASVALIDVDPHPIRRVLKRVAAYAVLTAAVAALVAGIVVWRPWEGRHTRESVHVLEIPSREVPAGRSELPAEAVTGTLTIRSNVPDAEIFVDAKKYTEAKGATELALTLPPATYIVRAFHPGYDESSPVFASVLTGINRDVDVFLAPKSVSPEASRAERQNAEGAPGAHVPAAEETMEDMQWSYVDPNDPQVLEAFLSKYPVGLHSNQAREQLQILERTATAKSLDQNDWVATNKSDKTALKKYLEKHPRGAHAAQARRFAAELDRWPAAALQRDSQPQSR
jgi:tetratricopeptide (TPR) repeat protein